MKRKFYNFKSKVSKADYEERIAFGQSLRTRRRILDLTQEAVADKMGITTTAYSKIERGESGISTTRLKQLADILGINAPDMLTEIPVNNMLMRDIFLEIISMNKKIDTLSHYIAAEKPAEYRTADTPDSGA
ncbi:MAG: helix-turn-helix domain-containing protein [Paludibacteraceae bacterium]|nr:helix-turn-helix domain-containing protein [Paludibacteraceae bacterium]